MKKLAFSVTKKALGFALILTAIAPAAFAQTRALAPEIDAGTAASALTLLVGGAMLLKDRFLSK